jgi:hypothetical protein
MGSVNVRKFGKYLVVFQQGVLYKVLFIYLSDVGMTREGLRWFIIFLTRRF